MSEQDKENFMKKVSQLPDGCWIWTKAIKKGRSDTHKYGWVTFKNKQMTANRLSWILFKGDIPANTVVCHKCDVTLCVNPEHLFIGTQKENIQDMDTKGRRNRMMKVRRVDGLHTSSKITKTQAEEMRRMHLSGLTQQKIAIHFNVSQTCISKSIRGVTSNVK